MVKFANFPDFAHFGLCSVRLYARALGRGGRGRGGTVVCWVIFRGTADIDCCCLKFPFRINIEELATTTEVQEIFERYMYFTAT